MACKKEQKSMPFQKKTHDLARSLVTGEAEANATAPQTETASERVYEKLRRKLGSPVGTDGFRALASRALALAKAESNGLRAVQIAANGGLRGLGEAESQTDADKDGEAGIILIAQLLGLFLAFLGEATTLRLIEDLRLQVDDTAESEAASSDTTDSEVERLVIAAAFGDLLREIDQLRTVSTRIENLADNHPGMEQGLFSAAGNIRNIATVLDVFTLIRSKAGGPQEDEHNSQSNGYMN
jgi:hypothetical protein